jgi:hypothetical protein
MKTFVKIAALAVTVALAVISCEPSIPDPHFEWWDEYNDQYDASKYTDRAVLAKPNFYIEGSNLPDGDSVFVWGLSDGADVKNNEVTITFPDNADVLKKDNLEAELKNFLSFYTFSTTLPALGKADELTEISDWEFDKRNGSDITVKLNRTFVGIYSRVVIKIDGTKYTYNNGLKMDRDGNGITGESGYDDFYGNIAFGSAVIRNAVFPVNRGWVITLVNLSVPTGTIDTSTEANIFLATNNIAGIALDDVDNILKAIMGGFKVEKFSNGRWSNHASASFDDATHSIIAKDNTYSHMTGYRVVFEKGSISLVTADEFFGIKQRITVITTAGASIYNTKINRTRLEATPGLYYNTSRREFYNISNKTYPIEVYSKDGFGGNIVLRWEMKYGAFAGEVGGQEQIISGGNTTYHYFKKIELTPFKNNFKIYSSKMMGLLSADDFVEIGITAVEFKRENPYTIQTCTGENVIYITLDPKYRMNSNYKFIYIGEGICYDSNIGVFSSPDIWDNNGFRRYSIGSIF